MTRVARIDLHKESLKFSAAHFTIFSATHRERLHGHNFAVSVSFVAEVGFDGLCVDYGVLKKEVQKLCDSLDEYTLIPKNSPHLSITEKGDYYYITFADKELRLLIDETLLLPIFNSTVEEYSYYLLGQLLANTFLMSCCPLQSITVTVSSGPGQSGSSCWDKP